MTKKDDYIRTEVVDTIEGVVCEEAYYNAAGEMIGYMAYGKYDPSLPYQGSKERYLNEIEKDDE